MLPSPLSLGKPKGFRKSLLRTMDKDQTFFLLYHRRSQLRDTGSLKYWDPVMGRKNISSTLNIPVHQGDSCLTTVWNTGKAVCLRTYLYVSKVPQRWHGRQKQGHLEISYLWQPQQIVRIAQMLVRSTWNLTLKACLPQFLFTVHVQYAAKYSKAQ